MLFFWSIDWSDQLSFKNFCGSRSRVNKSLCCGSLFLFVLYLMGQQCWHLTEGAEAIKVHSNISTWTATVFLLFFLLNAKCHLSFILIFPPFSPSRNESIHHNIIKRWLQGELRLLEQWSLSRQIAILQFFYRAIIFSASSLFPQQAETEHDSSERGKLDRYWLCRATTWLLGFDLSPFSF